MLLLLGIAAAAPSGGQETKPGPDLLSPDRIHQLVARGDKTAIPELRHAFRVAHELQDRQRIASALVRLGDPDQSYWEFLASRARAAVASEVPFPLAFDRSGKGVRGQFSPEFLSWSTRKGIDPAQAAEDALYRIPADLLFLATAADPRGFDILMRGLDSQNYFVVLQSARGLARLQDKRAIRPIIRAAERAPAEISTGIAGFLVFFDDTEAEAAAERLIGNKKLLDELREQALQGPKAIFGF